MDKTNVMRILDAAKINYLAHEYAAEATDGLTVAKLLGIEPERVFKTLVTEGDRGYYVFVIPVGATLDMKKAARAAGVKRVEMLKQKELLPLTGYVHGGCSPIDMKKPFPTCLDETACLFENIVFSAGKIGKQVELAPDDLIALIKAQYHDLTFLP